MLFHLHYGFVHTQFLLRMANKYLNKVSSGNWDASLFKTLQNLIKNST